MYCYINIFLLNFNTILIYLWNWRTFWNFAFGFVFLFDFATEIIFINKFLEFFFFYWLNHKLLDSRMISVLCGKMTKNKGKQQNFMKSCELNTKLYKLFQFDIFYKL